MSATVYSHETNSPGADPGATYVFTKGTLVKGVDDGAPRFTAEELPGVWDAVLRYVDGSVQTNTVTFFAGGTGMIRFPPSADNDFDPEDVNPIDWWLNASGQLIFLETGSDGEGPNDWWTWTYTRKEGDAVSCTTYVHPSNEDRPRGVTYRFPDSTLTKR